MLNVTKTIEGEKAVLSPEGRLDTVTAPEFETEIKEIIPGIKFLTLDFSNLSYISSAGLRVLLSAQKAISDSGEMKVINVNDTIMEIFDITGFSEILTIE